MRKVSVLCVIALTLAASGTAAGAATHQTVTAKHKPPVTLSGKVTNHGTKSAKANQIVVMQRNDYFTPTFVKAKPGTTLTVTIKNQGTQEHTFTVPGQAVDADLTPGKKMTVQVAVPSTGALRFYCRFHGPLGMQGAIFTKAGDPITNTGTSTLSAATAKPAQTKYGKILVDANGRTLYLHDSDTPTQVTCTGGCATIWPPLIATGTTPTVGPGLDITKLATVAGPNGTQVSYHGHPLYTYANDQTAGDTTGQGIGGFWVPDANGNQITAQPAAPTTTPTTTHRGGY
jgi:predicted lipoprotein with Yx(FWY)xxD motif/plastocyanin